MVKIVYAPYAIEDLEQIGDYIALKLSSPMAALNTINKIQNTIDKLTDFPKMGALLSSIVETDSNYRFLVCGNYIAFYRLQANYIFIDRILYGKRDYISILFPQLPQSDDG
jgi:addiction module RelE/StbE family toxin